MRRILFGFNVLRTSLGGRGRCSGRSVRAFSVASVIFSLCSLC